MEYNPFLPEVQADPFPYYAYLREHAPAYQVPGAGFWAISRYDDVLTIMKNPHVYSSANMFEAFTGDLNPFPPEAPPIVSVDPPNHTRLRKLVNRAFTPRRVASLEAHIHDVANDLVARLPAQGEFDVVSGLAAALPVIVIAELLGVPPERRVDFKRWADSLGHATNGRAVPEDARPQIRQNSQDLFAYFEGALEDCRKHPRDSLLNDLVRAEDENQTLTAAEVLSLAVFLIAAGSETTTNLIGNAMLLLCSHSEQMAKVRSNLALVPQMVEEVLRYESPLQTLIRQAMQDVEIAGTKIPAGSFVLFLLGSANRDERKFPEPDRFDVTRNADGHVGFGFGIHFCLGAQLARMEGQIALRALLERYPRLSRTDAPLARVESIVLRGPKALPLVAG